MSIAKRAFYAAGAAWAATTKHRPVGRNIYSAEWDICIVLDSARYDMLRDALTERATAAQTDAVWSRGSITTEWLSQTFRSPYEQAIADTTLVTASPHSQTVFGDGDWLTNSGSVGVPYPANPAVGLDAFDGVHELWRSHAGEHGAVGPATMRDATIEAHQQAGGRVVAHWLQPHEPFIAPDAEIVGGGPTETNVWDGLNSGRYEAEEVWQSYRATLDWGLDYVFDVLESVDADVLITADHGNAMGELGVYGHPFGWLQPAVRRVPWLETRATQLHDTEPDVLSGGERQKSSVDEQLAALGYQ